MLFPAPDKVSILRPLSHGVSRRLRPAAFLLALAASGLSSGSMAAEDAGANDAGAALRLLAFGDSLVHGYGLPAGETFPEQLEAALRAAGQKVEVINSGNSGDTTAAGRARLDWALADRPDAALVVLGANDGLRGLEPKETYANLDAILERLEAEGLPVLLAGMLAPRNLGPDYDREFDAVYPRLAKAHAVALYPFFLEGVAMDPKLNQPDGIHPNAAGVAVIVKAMLPQVIALLERARDREQAGGAGHG